MKIEEEIDKCHKIFIITLGIDDKGNKNKIKIGTIYELTTPTYSFQAFVTDVEYLKNSRLVTFERIL